MQRLFTILLTFLLVGAACGARAQSPTQTAAGFVLPWNGLLPSRVYQPYTSIIGKPGTMMIPGSDHAMPNDPTFTVPLPFAVQMLGTTYPAGYGLKVGVAGFASFNSGAVTGAWPYLLMPDPNYTTVLMPYWSDLRTSGAPGEGIYYRYEIDPTSQDTTWTVEWNVEAMSPPISSGRFQMVLTRPAAWSGVGVPLVMVQYNYDKSSPIIRPNSGGHFGAQVGIKNLGQAVGPQTTYAPGDDDDQFLLMTYPPAFTSPFVTAITRLPTRVVGTQGFTPDWYATASTTSISYFHYTFPDSSYRVKPIDADASCVRKGNDSDGLYVGTVYPPGTQGSGGVLVFNHGTVPLFNVPVHISLKRDGKTVDSIDQTIKVLAPQDSFEVKYPIPTSGAGEYRVRAVVSAAGDLYHANDSAAWSIWVSPTTDIMAVAIVSPELIAGPRARLYPAGAPIDFTVRVANVGTTTPKEFYVGFWLRDAIGNVIATNTLAFTPLSFPTGGELDMTVGTFTPSTPGRYYVDAVAFADSDQIHSNDTLRGVPARDRITRGTMIDDRHISQIPFEVVAPVAVEPGDPGYYPYLPAPGDTIHDSSQVMAMFINNGTDSLSDLGAHVKIVDGENTTVYTHDVKVPMIAAQRRVAMQYFPDFHPTKSGVYIATASLDPQPGNTTDRAVQWAFYALVKDTSTVDTSTSAVPGIGTSELAGARLTVAPNPASDRASLQIVLPSPLHGRLVVTDLLGRSVRAEERQFEAGGQTIALDVDGLPNGAYVVRIESAGAPIASAHFVIER